MHIQILLILTLLISSILISINAGFYLIARYRTRLAILCGFILLSQAVEIGCYLLRFSKLIPHIDPFLNLLQIFSYTLFSFFWLLFVFVFTRHAQWIRPRNIALILSLPTIYFLIMVVRLYQGVPTNTPGTEAVGSLMEVTPLVKGVPGLLFIIGRYGDVLVSILLLLQLYSKFDVIIRRLIIPLLGGPSILAITGILELANINPVKPFSIQQLACTMISFLAFWMILDLRFGNILLNAREVVIEQMQDGVVILDQEDRIVFMNASAQQIIGQNSQHAVQQNLSHVWPKAASMIASLSDTDLPVGEISIQKNGENYTFDINISQLYDAYREPIGRTIVLRNVTGRERMEKALNEHSQELQRTNALLEALAKVNVSLQTTTDPSQIYTILGNEMNKLGLVCFIAQLDLVSNGLIACYLSYQSKVIERIEKLLGNKLVGFRLSREQFSKLYTNLEANEISYEKLHSDDLADIPGKISVRLMEQAIRMIDLEPDMAALVLPLVTGERTFGLMGI